MIFYTEEYPMDTFYGVLLRLTSDRMGYSLYSGCADSGEWAVIDFNPKTENYRKEK